MSDLNYIVSLVRLINTTVKLRSNDEEFKRINTQARKILARARSQKQNALELQKLRTELETLDLQLSNRCKELGITQG